MVVSLYTLLGCPAGAALVEGAYADPLPAAHAHNDYLHERPLLDALEHGFTSVEADVFLVDGELLVAHTRGELQRENTLRRLYLEPLRDRVAQVGGSVYPGGGRFQLLIDIKADGEQTYAALSKLLAEFSEIITVVNEQGVQRRPVDVVVSGDRPIRSMAAQSVRYAAVDGRLSDLDSDLPVHLMPLLSDRWGDHFQWQGQGPIDEPQRQKLEDIVAKAHAAGRRLRFWAMPDTPPAWQLFRDLGVDHINTDDLAGLAKFLRSEPKHR